MFSHRHCENKLKLKTSLDLKSLRHSAVKRDIIARSLSLNVKSETTPYISETGSMYSIQTAFVFKSSSSPNNSIVRGHSGRSKTYKLVSRAYWWLNVYKYVQRFVWNCHICSWSKLSHQWTQGWLRPLPVPEHRWHDVFMDYVGPLLVSTVMGVIYCYVLIFVDRLTKMRHLVLTATMKVEEVTQAFYAYV